MAKIKKNIIYYVMAVVCSTAFFIHEFIPKNSEGYLMAVDNHAKAKKIRTIALENLKNSTKDSKLYDVYIQSSIKTDLEWNKYLIAEKEEVFLGFDNFQQFLGEFGWALGLFIYSIFNIYITFIKNRNTKYGEIILHSTLNFISLYFVSWALQQSTPDYTKNSYVIYSILMTISIVWGTSKLVRYKENYIRSLFLNIRDLIGFMFNNTKKESEDKMWDILKKVEHDRK
ncbi:hypothetical protein ACSTS3_04725 [Aquimarina muelleri]|uniref:hypothetical protein n=1 Tax=Aquimarina muelleri TaxID=279356 RepID=UPI003F684332